MQLNLVPSPYPILLGFVNIVAAFFDGEQDVSTVVALVRNKVGQRREDALTHSAAPGLTSENGREKGFDDFTRPSESLF